MASGMVKTIPCRLDLYSRVASGSGLSPVDKGGGKEVKYKLAVSALNIHKMRKANENKA
jgi:hypothetical protein